MEFNRSTTVFVAIFASLAGACAVAWYVLGLSGDRGEVAQPTVSASNTPLAGSDAVHLVMPMQRIKVPLGSVLVPGIEYRPEARAGAPSDEIPYVGPTACGECHPKKLEGFCRTTHFLTSRAADSRAIMGNFEAGHNQLPTQAKNLHYEMLVREDEHFQAAFVDGKEAHRERFDIVTGSGKIGQSYLYWKYSALFQLPVSYFSHNESWSDSPGFPNGIAQFARPIVGRCLECHTTYFRAKDASLGNYHYDQSNYILGVTCERCHGPGRDHVDFHRRHPDADETEFIVHPGKLPRNRLNDVCAQCHSGTGSLRRPAFSFRPGERLADHVKPSPAMPGRRATRPGVHTNNQLQRLEQSACFRNSPTMSCATCHNPHELESGDTALFSSRCQTCHEMDDCHILNMAGDLSAEFKESFAKRCVECHMEKRTVLDMIARTAEDTTTVVMWDHLIQRKPNDVKLHQILRQIRADRKP